MSLDTFGAETGKLQDSNAGIQLPVPYTCLEMLENTNLVYFP